MVDPFFHCNPISIKKRTPENPLPVFFIFPISIYVHHQRKTNNVPQLVVYKFVQLLLYKDQSELYIAFLGWV